VLLVILIVKPAQDLKYVTLVKIVNLLIDTKTFSVLLTVKKGCSKKTESVNNVNKSLKLVVQPTLAIFVTLILF